MTRERTTQGHLDVKIDSINKMLESLDVDARLRIDKGLNGKRIEWTNYSSVTQRRKPSSEVYDVLDAIETVLQKVDTVQRKKRVAAL